MIRIASYDVREQEQIKEKEKYINDLIIEIFDSVKKEIKNKYYTFSERNDLLQRVYWLIHHSMRLANNRFECKFEIQKSDVLHSLMTLGPQIQDDSINEVFEDIYACLIYRYCCEVRAITSINGVN